MRVRAVQVQGAGHARPRGAPPRARLAPAQEYPSHIRALMIAALPLRADGPGPAPPGGNLAGRRRAAAPRRPRRGDGPGVRRQADAFLDAGARFTLWSGGEVGHGTIYRRVFTDYGPS